MLEPNNKKRPELWDRLVMDQDGVLFLDGLRIVFLPASTLTDIEAAGEKVIGRGLGSILYRAGERTGHDIGVFMKGFLGPSPAPEVVLQAVERGHRERGYGRVEFVSHDLSKGELTAKVCDSPYAEIREGARLTACYFPAGFWAGFVANLSEKTVHAEEVQCKGTGAPHCEFVVRPGED